MLARYGISLGSVSLETVREGDKLSRSRTRVEGFVLAPPLRGLQGLQTRLALQSMGLKEVKLDLDCAGTDDRAKGELTLDRCALVGPDLGEIDLTGRIVDVDPPFWRAIDDGDLLAFDESHAGVGRDEAGPRRQEPARAQPEGAVDGDRQAGLGNAIQSGERDTPLPAGRHSDIGGHDEAARHRRAVRRAWRHAHARCQA